MKLQLLLLLALPATVLSQSGTYQIDALVTAKKKQQVVAIGGAGADVSGFTNEAIQIGVDAVKKDGGTVKLNPGVYQIKAPVKLPSNVNLIGSGPGTILKRIDGFHSKFAVDADYGELKLTVADASGFAVGMSVQIKDDANSDCWDVSTAVITDISGNTLYIDKYLIRDYEADKNGWVTNAGSCIQVEEANNVEISNLTIEGNKEKNDLLDGCNGGGIAIIKSKKVTVDNVHVANFNGEGITWQITENVTVRNSEINDCANMGLHPGTGSPNTLIENNNIHNNKTGLFICWRVQNSVVKGNKMYNNQEYGISTGHKDSDVIFENNHVAENGVSGVRIRRESEKNSPHRNSFIKNTIENNGGSKDGYGFIVEGNSADMVLKDNIIHDTKGGSQKAGILMGKNTTPIKLQNNTMSGHKLGNIVYDK